MRVNLKYEKSKDFKAEFPLDFKQPEFGGRFQHPVPRGEIGLSYHHRTVNTTSFSGLETLDGITENKYGVDAKWDVTVGLWFEATYSKKSKNIGLLTHQSLLNIGSDYTFSNGRVQKSGTIGHIGCTSFFPSKNLGCYGDGGAIFTNDDELAIKLRQTANHGQSKQYIHNRVGVNSRLDSIQAAVLRIKLRQLDEYSNARNIAADFYDSAFANHPNLKTPKRVPFSNHVFHQYTLQLNDVDRGDIRTFLSDKGVPAMIYYPIPLHLQEAYTDPRYKEGDFPVTEKLCSCVISLPMQTELDNEQLTYITQSVLDFFNK